MWEILLDTAVDTVKLIPFLFLTYLLMEYMEHKTGEKARQMVRHAGRMGPVIGGILGIFPQCGFSAAASGLYAGKVISMGTLIAIYLSTSDEMLPVMISEKVPVLDLVRILLLKMLIGVVAGILIDFSLGKKKAKQGNAKLDERESHHEHCCKNGIFMSALEHTLQILVFLFLISLILNGVIAWIGEEQISHFMMNRPVWGELIAGLVGLIPNCAASVVITQLYLEGMISFGAMMSGVLVGAGLGLLVLFRVNEDKKECLKVLCLLYAIGVAAGIVIEFLT
ncbi:MAG: putative manganese transporter [Lachnospiraceae bacterium]|nr:arsenic efflux protein [Robinsoniella sp.]MDY3765886.1 putative manganese transporter [Lachnospiraceae bacterium]